MKLTAAQERMLLELAEPNANSESEWAIRGRGPVQAADSLVRLGFARRHESWGGHHQRNVFSLTPAGKTLASKVLAEQAPHMLPSGTRWHDGKRWREMGGDARREGDVYVWFEPDATERWEAPIVDREALG